MGTNEATPALNSRKRNTVNLTEAWVRSVKPADFATIYWDTEIGGLGLRVAKTGKKVFILDYRTPDGRHPKKTIGVVGAMTVKDARLKAGEIKAQSAKGEDPLATSGTKTVAFLAEKFIAAKLPRREDMRVINTYILQAFGKRKLISIRRHEVREWHARFMKTVTIRNDRGKVMRIDRVPATGQANRALAIFRAMMNWAEEEEYKPLHSNPCARIKMHEKGERHYEWDTEEKRRFKDALSKLEAGARTGTATGSHGVNVCGEGGLLIGHYPALHTTLAFKFLVLTGVRKSECLTLKWEQVKWKEGVIVWDRHKTKKKTRKPLIKAITLPLRRLLEELQQLAVEHCPYVFPGRDAKSHLIAIEKVWDRIRTDARLQKDNGEKPRIHDLRHAYGDAASDLGLTGRQIMLVMNHTDERTSVIYAKGTDEAKRAHEARLAEAIAVQWGL